MLLLVALTVFSCAAGNDALTGHVRPCTSYLGLQNVVLWRSNQTHDLHMTIGDNSGNCTDVGTCGQDTIVESSIDIQSGDILQVYLNITDDKENGTSSVPPATTPSATTVSPAPTVAPVRVFSVSRPGPTTCDTSDGVPLDVVYMTIDGSNLLTFYEKDLTEGINMLLIVSGSWGGRCAKIKVTVKSNNCGDSENCSKKGACYTNSSMEDYECQCCHGYIGPHCEEWDSCFRNPCKNNGICVDISQGHEGNTFQCLCPFGFTGKFCQDTTDPCQSSPCQHGGSCRQSNETAHQYKCTCSPGFTGTLCQTPLDICGSYPCHNGICVNEHDGFRCFCRPGFTGNQCEEEYNECESSPCKNGGTCIDRVNAFSCTCPPGYTGNRCQYRVVKNLCEPNPCSHHHYCINKPNNTYSCECPKGYTGANCLIPTRAACSANPCRNGGTCWSSVDSFYCACRPGFTGKICNEEVIMEAIPSASDTIEIDGSDPVMDLETPLDMSRVPLHLDHLHNVYVAAGTLACAILIVIVTVIICHCRMHETYKHCCFKTSPLIPCHITRLDTVLKKNGIERDKEPLAKSRPFPALDSSDMYYALDFSDSQSSPLIQ